MISYDTYQNKIKRVAAIKNFIVRFRALFIALFAVIIALILTFIFIKGMVTQDVILPDRIVYGDDYEIQAPKALFSDAKYQFKSVNEASDAKSSVKRAVSDENDDESGWTDVAPKRAGEYLIRVVTKKTFGISYGTPKKFTIEKFETEFTITADSVVYGGTLSGNQYEFKLVNGDRLLASGLELDYRDTDTVLDVADICAKADSFVIFNKANEDVTDCYDISVPVKENVKLNVNNNLVTLMPSITNVEYDGTEVKYDNECISDLKGVSIETEIRDSADNVMSAKPVNAGAYTVVIIPEKIKILSGDGVDVTKYYSNIKCQDARFNITPREVTAITADDEKEYDGTPLVNSTVVYDGLIDGHTAKATYIGESAIDAKTYINAYSFTVSSASGEDMTENYQFISTYGTLTITPRPVTVKTESDEKVYDGTALVNDTVELEGLVTDHNLSDKIYVGETAINVGTYENRYACSVSSASGEDVTANYQFNYENGTLKISQREINVTSLSGSWVYDGWSHNNLTVIENENVTLADKNISGKPLADGEEIFAVEEGSTIVCDYTEEAVKNVIVCKIYGASGETTANYKINYVEYGTLSIEKRTVTVNTLDASHEYDGTAFTSDAWDYADTTEYKLVAWAMHKLSAVTETQPQITEVGSTENKVSYQVVDANGSNAVDINYELKFADYGTLTVTSRDVTITTATLEKVYGKPLYGEATMNDGEGAFTIISAIEVEGLAPNQTYAVDEDTAVSVTDVCTDVTNTTKYKLGYFDENKKFVDTTENYNIFYDYGSLTVKQRTVMVNTANLPEKEYDGTPLYSSAEGYYISLVDNSKWFDLFDNHRLVADDVSTTITDVGEKNNVASYKVFCGSDDVSENYLLSYTYGKMKITPRVITVITASDEWVYSDVEYYNYDAKVKYGDFSGGNSDELFNDETVDEIKPFVLDHKLEVESPFKLTGVLTSENKCTYKVTDKDGEVVSSNYDIKMVYGTLTVKPRPLTITTADGHRVYDDTPYTNIVAVPEEYDFENERGLIVGHSIEYDANQTTASVTYVTQGKVKNELHYLIFKTIVDEETSESETIDVTENYAIKYNYGEIYIDKRPISITTATSSKEFDGAPYYNCSFEVTEGSFAEGSWLIGQYNVASVTYVTEGEVENRIEYHIGITAIENGDIIHTDLTDNYEIKYTYGKISRTARFIVVTTNSHTWTYDGAAHSDTGYESCLHYKDIVYGDDGSFIDGIFDFEDPDGLKLGHRLVVQEGYTQVIDYSVNVPNEVSYIVENDEINKNYYLFVSCGKLSVMPRSIKITTDDGHAVFNGDAFKHISADAEEFDEDNESGLVAGHEIVHDTTKTTASVTYVTQGKVTNELHYLIYKGSEHTEENDVTKNYLITYGYGDIWVTARPITITTGSYSKKYDGTPLEYAAYDWSRPTTNNTEGLIESKGHYTELDTSEKVASITYITLDGIKEVSDTPNERHYLIKNSDGDDISANYDISYSYGTLTITKRPLKITTATITWSYDGQWHYGENLDMLHRLAQFDNLVSVDGVSEFSLAGNKAKIIDYTPDGIVNDTEYQFVILDDTTESGYFHTTQCYDIEYEYGTLFINQVDLYITTSSPEKVYDGTALTGDDENYAFPEFVGIVEGELYESYDVAERTDVGTKTNTTQYVIYAYREVDGEDAVKPVYTTGNYIPHYTYGEMKITHRTVTIKTLDKSHEYDGNEFTSDEWDYADSTEYELVDGHDLQTVSVIGKITDVKYKNGEIVGVENEVTYKVVDGDNDDKVNSNYILKYEYGTLTVTPRNVSVTTVSRTWVYDGDPHSDNGYAEESVIHIDKDGNADGKVALVGNHSLKGGLSTRVVDYVVDEPNVAEYTVVSGDDDVSGNYKIKYVYGKLNISKRPLTITTATKDSEYNGTPFSWTADYVVEAFNFENKSGIVKEQTVRLKDGEDIASVTYVHEGKVDNVLVFEIIDSNGSILSEYGNNLSDNYAITYNYGKLSITAHAISVTNITDTKEYDGTYLTGDDERIFDGLLLVEDYCEADVIAKIIDFGEIDNDTTYKIFNKDGDEITDSYDITYEGSPTLSITLRRDIHITTLSFEKIYDGKALSGDAETEENKPVFARLVDGETYKAVAATVTKITDCGETENTTQYKIFAIRDGKEVETTQNYDISVPDSYTYGTLKITERKIIISTASDAREFNGSPLTKTDGYGVTGDGLAEGQELYVKENAFVASITYVTDGTIDADGNGSIPNKIDYSIRIKNGEDVSSNYVIVRYWNNDEGAEYGTLTVTPRQIAITTATNETFEYDGKEHWDYSYANISHSVGQALVLDHRLDKTSYTTIVEADSTDNIVTYRILDSKDKDVSANYAITYAYGTLTVNRRKLTISLNTVADSTYGEAFTGYPNADGMFSIISGSTAEGETLILDIKYKSANGDDVENYPVNAGTYNVVIDFDKMYISGGYESLDNYSLTVKETSFTIARRVIIINLLEAGSKVYDGSAYVFPADLDAGYELVGGEIVEGDKLAIAVKYTLNNVEAVPLNAGTYTITFDLDNCSVNGDKELALNYAIECLDGNGAAQSVQYVINKRTLDFGLKSLTHAYVGTYNYSFPDGDAMDFDETQIAETDYLYEVFAATKLDGEFFLAVDVGVYDYAVRSFTIKRMDNNSDVSSNYELVSENTATLTIVKREIEVGVWFDDTSSNSSSREFINDVIDLKAEFPDYGPYTSTSTAATSDAPWGIYADDLAKINAVFSYKRKSDGSDTELIELGEYTVSVILENAEGYDVLDRNYDITGYSVGEFEVTLRQINVIAKEPAEQLVYNGEKIAEKYLDYETEHKFTGTVGFLEEADADDYKAVYSLYSVDNGSKNLIDSILQAGKYYLQVKLEYIGEEGKEKYTIVSEIQSDIFEVAKRVIYANTLDDDNPYVYNRTAVPDPEEYTTYYYSDGVWSVGGFVNDDDKYIDSVIYAYYLASSRYDSAIDAGEYEIKIDRFEGKNGDVVIQNNYEVRDFGDFNGTAPYSYGKVKIKPAILIVLPKSHSEKYNGKRYLDLPANSYEISFVENNGNQLYGNEGSEKPITLSFEASDRVDITQFNMAFVSFTDVTIEDGGKDITSNYDIIYTYEKFEARLDELTELLGEESAASFTFNKFSVQLSYTQREVYVSQIAPPEEYKTVQFGTTVFFQLDDPSLDNYVLDQGDGLVPEANHKIEVDSAMISAYKLGVYKSWILGTKVYNATTGEDVSWGYRVKIVNDDENIYKDTYITVVPKDITVNVDCAPSEFEEGKTEYKVLDSLVLGETLTVSVVDGEYVAEIIDFGGNNNNRYYNVIFKYPDSENNEKEDTEYASRL